MKMHEDELDIDPEVVRELIATQFPEWSTAQLTRVHGSGTMNAIFRIGDRLAARFPVRMTDAATTAQLRAEASAMEEMAGHSPFPVPRHVAIGRPASGYPLAWSVQTWLEGDVATPDGLADSEEFAADLADLIGALRTADTRGRRFAGGGRGGDLRSHDDWVAECIRNCAQDYDAALLTSLWTAFRALPRTAPDVMTHGDLTPMNVLVRGGRIAGVLDAGGFGPADPALDLVCAWHLLDPEPRAALRDALGSDDLEWLRGAAWAFQQAMGLVWYYRESNPVMGDLGRSTMDRLLADAEIVGLADAARSESNAG